MRRAFALLSLGALLSACGGGGTKPPVVEPSPELRITAEGRQERGSIVTLSAVLGSTSIPAEQVSWSVSPAGSAELVEGTRLRLLSTGPVTLRGERQGSVATLTLQVSAPPTIVFDMLAAGNRDIYRVSLDGRELTRLTTELADDSSPTVGGGKIVFVSYRHGNAELYSIPLAGGAATRLTSTSPAETAPALSPDGERLAFAYESSGVAKIFTASATGASRAAAAPGFGFPGSPETSPAWAPTGNRLAFVGTANGSADIFEVTPGGTPVLRVGGTAAHVDPAWSPDGSRIAFASNRDGDPALYVVTVPGGQVTRLSDRPGMEAEPTWTADGRIVYVEFLEGNASRLVWIDPSRPDEVHPIPLDGAPRRPAAVR